MSTEMSVLPIDAVIEKDGQILTTSLKIAEVFGRKHDNVLKAVKALDCSDDFRRVNFNGADYIDAQGKPRPMFEMTRDGMIFLVMGFTGADAARWKEAYIRTFNAMEAALMQQATPLQQPKTIKIEEVEYWRMKAELAELKLAQETKRQRRPFTDHERITMHKLRAQGQSLGAIARHLGRNPSSVRGFFKV